MDKALDYLRVIIFIPIFFIIGSLIKMAIKYLPDLFILITPDEFIDSPFNFIFIPFFIGIVSLGVPLVVSLIVYPYKKKFIPNIALCIITFFYLTLHIIQIYNSYDLLSRIDFIRTVSLIIGYIATILISLRITTETK